MTPSRSALRRLSDRQLLDSLHAVVGRDRRLTAEMLEHLGEVDVRELCAREAEGSLYVYCVKVLRFSEGCAYKRIAAARVARRYPVVLDMVARGDLHVSAVNMLVPHLTAENHRELLEAAARKSKRELAEVLAARFPKPDVESRVRKLPERHAERRTPQLELSAAPAPALPAQSPQFSDAQGTGASALAGASASVPSEVTTGQAEGPSAATLVLSSPGAAAAGSSALAPAPAPVHAAARPQDRPSVQPLSPGRYKLQVTLSRQGRDDLLRAQELMRHQQPDGDLAVVVERALADLVVELERRKFGRLKGRGKRGASASASRADAAAGGTSVSSQSTSSHVREQARQPKSGREQPQPVLTRAANANDQPQLDLLPGANASDRPEVELPSAVNASEQPQVDLLPGANASDRPEVELPSAANASEQPQVDLLPGANASDRPEVELPPASPAANTSDQPEVELSPPANVRAANPGGGRVDGRRRGRPRGALSRYLPRALVREVVRRDGMQCTYVGADGRRCEARDFLEFHHIVPVARGGKATVENVCLRCRVHHGVETVRQFGADVVRRHAKRRP